MCEAIHMTLKSKAIFVYKQQGSANVETSVCLFAFPEPAPKGFSAGNNNNSNNILYSSQQEIKAIDRSHNEEHISIILSHETHAIRLIRDGEKGGGEGVWRWGKKEIIYLSLRCHHQNYCCIKIFLKNKESQIGFEPRFLCLPRFL